MTEYRFALLAVTVTVSRQRGGFEAVISDGGEVIGRGQDKTEAGAVGLAVLAARSVFETCNGCGQTFYRDTLEQDDLSGLWYCGDCWRM